MDSIPEPFKTPKGARYDLAIYIYPDEHGNITFGSKSGTNFPVANEEEAVAVFRSLWRAGVKRA